MKKLTFVAWCKREIGTTWTEYKKNGLIEGIPEHVLLDAKEKMITEWERETAR
jgi:hypothetical protein